MVAAEGIEFRVNFSLLSTKGGGGATPEVPPVFYDASHLISRQVPVFFVFSERMIIEFLSIISFEGYRHGIRE